MNNNSNNNEHNYELGNRPLKDATERSVNNGFTNISNNSKPTCNDISKVDLSLHIDGISNHNDSNNNINKAFNRYDNKGLEANKSNIYNNFGTNEVLLKAFMGNSYNHIMTTQVNFLAFILGSLYYFGKKMILYGIILSILFVYNLYMGVVIHFWGLFILYYLLLFFMTNKVYLYYVNDKINKIKKANPLKSEDELALICQKTGGFSIGYMLLGMVVLGAFCLMAFRNDIGSIKNSGSKLDNSININYVNKDNI